MWCQTQCQEPRRVRASWIKLVRVLKNSRKVNQERVLRHIHTCTHRRIFEISNDESAFSSGFFKFFLRRESDLVAAVARWGVRVPH